MAKPPGSPGWHPTTATAARLARPLAPACPFRRLAGKARATSVEDACPRAARSTWPRLSAVRHDRILREFYTRLCEAGKKPLVALTAAMRKLVVLLNRMLKMPAFTLAG